MLVALRKRRPNLRVVGGSPRERDVLRQFAEFPRVKEVSARLRISPHTVRSHLKSLYRKLGVSSQLELLRLLTGEPAQPA